MIRPLIAAAAALLSLAVATPAVAAAPSCSRGGARLLAASGGARVVSVRERPRNAETRRDRLYGCWTKTGRRFALFLQRDFGLDLVERATIEIVDGRYIGVIREFEGGASESRTAATWDAARRVRLRTSKPCDSVSVGDFSGVEDAAFYRDGGLAYSCNGALRLADAKGDRELEPAGAGVLQLAVARNAFGYGERLYYTVGSATRSVAL